MEICSGGRGFNAHPEIVHNEGSCPLCDMRDDLKGQIEDLNNTIEKLEANHE